jgi:GT2 family glycosyltransferase
MPESLRYSVLVVNWNVRDLLRTCLASVYAEAREPSSQFEVIVVDNASGDGSAAMVAREFPQVRLIESADNLGFGRANNLAYGLSRGRAVVLLNPDTVVLDGALERAVARLESLPRVGVLGTRLVNADGSLQRWTGGALPGLRNVLRHHLMLDRVVPRSWRGPSLFLDDDVEEDVAVEWVSGACMVLRREALAGRLFDERFFMYGEDLELCARLRAAGWGVLYSPVATVIHHQGRSMEQQSGAILLTSLKGPRAFYLLRHGRRTVWLYDLITATGFLLRWIAYSVLALGRAHYAVRASSSRRYMTRAVHVLIGR